MQRQRIFTALFLALLCLPLLRPLPSAQGLVQPSASRPGQLRQALQASQGYRQRFDDSFFLRQEMITLFNSARLRLPGERSISQVLVGEEGWLYYNGERNLDFYQCLQPLSPARLDAIEAQLESTRRRLQEQGIAFVLVIAPNKESIYPEYLPAAVKRGAGPCPLDQLVERLQARGFPLVDPRPALLQAKRTQRVYFQTDTHWNSLGAYLAAGEILRPLQAQFPDLQPASLADYARLPEPVSGDLARMLAVSPTPQEHSEVLQPRFALRAQSISPDGDRTIYTEVPGASLPSALVFRDSFSNGLIPYLSEYFSRAVWTFSARVDFESVEKEAPQVVILEVAERYIERIAE